MTHPPYRAPAWLPGGHAQTVWPLLRRGSLPPYRRQRWATPDGDFIDLDWIDGVAGAPLLALFHGLEGSSASHYARSLMRAVAARGWNGVVVHFRGCSGEPNRLPRAYHSGDADEIDWILRRLGGQSGPLYAVGVSLGGNALLKWLGREGEGAAAVVAAAASVCAPIDLAAANAALMRGASRIYTYHFLATLIPRAVARLRQFPGLYSPARVRAARSLKDFDDAVTAPLHGFRDAEDYYARCSAKPVLADIRVPTLLVQALNDPFLPAKVLPGADAVGSAVTLEYATGGGHVGFVAGAFPGHLDWLPSRLLAFFERPKVR